MGFHVFGGADAPTLMLLHGASTTWEKSFGEAIPLLSRRYRVIAYGTSGFDPGEDSIFRNAKAEADRIATYIHAELSGAVDGVYAHSLGGQTASYLAHRQDLGIGAVILDGPVYANTGSFTNLMATIERPLARMLASDAAQGIARRTGLPILPGDVGENIYSGAKEESFRNTAWSNLAWSADLHTLEPRPGMHVHCWWGQRERRSVRRSVTLLARVFPGLRTKEFIGLSHGELHTRHPARLKDALERVI